MTILPTEAPASVFRVLQDILYAFELEGRVLHAPAAKIQLLKVMPDFNERDLGVKKFVDVLRAGTAEGYFGLEFVDGHPRIVPAGKVSPCKQSPDELAILRADIWANVVNWSEGIRYWDKAHSRPIFVPTDGAGHPLWEVFPDDFVEITPVRRELQITWMHDFAESLEDPAKSELREALQGGAHGAFKRVLRNHGLQQAWSTSLQKRVLEHTFLWAKEAGVPVESLIGSRVRPSSVPFAEEPSNRHHPEPAPSDDSVNSEDALRAHLHRVLDRMSFAELASLQIPAGHLFSS